MTAGGWQRRRLILGCVNLNRDLDLAASDSALELLEFFRDAGLLRFDGRSVGVTDKGLLRAEEMSYYLAEQAVQDALRRCNGRPGSSRYNYFVTRTPEQEESLRRGLRTYQQDRRAARTETAGATSSARDRRNAEEALAGGTAC
jgi:hypothetical protein